jgi:hypothetical protein
MAILLVIGVMDLGAMAAITAAITVERLAPAGERVARATGAIVVVAGLLLIARRRRPGLSRRRRLPAGARRAAQHGVHGVDLTTVHLEHVHVGVAHEHGHADADAGLRIGEEDRAGSWPAFPSAVRRRSSRRPCRRTNRRRSPGAGSC